MLRQWQDLTVDSNPVRAGSANSYVWKKHKPAVTAKAVTPVNRFTGGVGVPMRPGVALARLGELTTPPLGVSTFWLASRWSWVRYFWAFEGRVAGSSLRLSAPAMGLVEHHRQLFSEQIGVALGLEAVLRHLLAGQPAGTTVEPVDADQALADQQVGGFGVAAVKEAGKSRPDYFAVRRQPCGLVDVFAIECKGTFAAKATCRRLAKAATQLETVVLGDPVPPGGPVPPVPAGAAAPTGYITSAALNDKEIRVELFDPPGDDRWRGRAAPRSERMREQRLVRRVDPDRDVVENPERFRRRLLDLVEMRQLAVAGRADAFTERAEQMGVGERPMVRAGTYEPYHDPDFGDFDGSTLRLPLEDGAVLAVFLGTRRDRADALARDDETAIEAAGQRWTADRGPSEDDGAVIRGDGDGYVGTITVARADGQLLRADIAG